MRQITDENASSEDCKHTPLENVIDSLGIQAGRVKCASGALQ